MTLILQHDQLPGALGGPEERRDSMVTDHPPTTNECPEPQRTREAHLCFTKGHLDRSSCG